MSKAFNTVPKHSCRDHVYPFLTDTDVALNLGLPGTCSTHSGVNLPVFIIDDGAENLKGEGEDRTKGSQNHPKR